MRSHRRSHAQQRIDKSVGWLCAPYREQPWWVLATTGIVAVVFGLTADALFRSSGDASRFLVGLGLLWAGVDQVVAGVRVPRISASPWRVVPGVVGAAAAVTALLSPWAAAFPPHTVWRLLALGFVAFGALEIVIVVFGHRAQGLTATAGSALRSALVSIVIGTLFLTVVPAEAFGDKGEIGTVAVFLGIVLLVCAVATWRQASEPA